MSDAAPTAVDGSPATSPPPLPASEAVAHAGPERGFDSSEHEVRIKSLPVRGELPEWLEGALVRTGPSQFESGEAEMRHWFDGMAMLHRFGIADGRVSYASRFLGSNAHEALERDGKLAYSEFATDPCRSLFKRAVTMFKPNLTDNCNVNLVKLGERFVAMTETPLPVQFDGETLAAAGVAWEVPGELTTAHPHLDRSTGGLINYAAKLGPKSEYRFFGLAPDGTEPRMLTAGLQVSRPAYMHSFGLTERWLVLAEFPYVVNPLEMVVRGRPYIENYRWKPELGTRFTLIDRKTGEKRGPFSTEACFGFHHVNAYEEGDEVVCDICTFDDPAIVRSLYLGNLRAGEPLPLPRLRRFRIGLASGTVEDELLTPEPIDLPRIDYGRCNERPHRYVWGAGLAEDGTSSFFDRILTVDLDAPEGSRTTTWSEPGCYPGEPVFVARPGATDEGDGVLLSAVFDGDSATSFLLALDAASLAELGRASVPHHIPHSFHGQFARN